MRCGSSSRTRACVFAWLPQPRLQLPAYRPPLLTPPPDCHAARNKGWAGAPAAGQSAGNTTSVAGLPCAGKYSDSYPGYNKDVYGSSSFHDKLFLAAAWLYRATGVDAARSAEGKGAGAAQLAGTCSCLATRGARQPHPTADWACTCGWMCGRQSSPHPDTAPPANHTCRPGRVPAGGIYLVHAAGRPLERVGVCVLG